MTLIYRYLYVYMTTSICYSVLSFHVQIKPITVPHGSPYETLNFTTVTMKFLDLNVRFLPDYMN